MQSCRKPETRTPTRPSPEEQVYHKPKIAAITPVRPAAAGLKPMAWASLFLVLVEVELDGVVPEPPGLVTLPWQRYFPLMTLLAPFSALKIAQSASRLAVDWMLKAPRLSLRAGSETL